MAQGAPGAGSDGGKAADARGGNPPPAGGQGDHDLRRVLDDDREVDGLGEQELLDIYRSMVLLRTYDERSVVYHRQGRIGTYAIFWNHEAMQAGAGHAPEDEGRVLPRHPGAGGGLLRGMPA